MPAQEVFISVDVETAGPNPATYSLLSIGACRVDDLSATFYIELRPVQPAADPAALEISGLSMAELAETGLPPAEALAHFDTWIAAQLPPSGRAVFVAFNAPFDWMFVNDYFYRYLGRNPFGHSALDIKAFYMGVTGAPWSETSLKHVAARFGRPQSLSHNALDDARDQAELFRRIVEEASAHPWAPP